MFSKVIVSSLLLAALANGLVFKRDDGYSTSTGPLPTATPPPILLPDPSISLSLPPLDSDSTGIPTSTLVPPISLPSDPSISLSLPPPSIALSLPPLDPTGTPSPDPSSISLPDPSISLSLPPLDPTGTPSPNPSSISLPDPSISLSLPPLDPSSTGTPTPTLLSSPLSPSIVTTTVYVYPTECSPTGTPLPTPVPSNVGALPQDDPVTFPPSDQSTTIIMPGEPTPLVLPPVRRAVSVVSQLRNLQQQVVNTWMDLGKGNRMVPVVGQLESLIAQASAPGADGPALLKQAQSLVNV